MSSHARPVLSCAGASLGARAHCWHRGWRRGSRAAAAAPGASGAAYTVLPTEDFILRIRVPKQKPTPQSMTSPRRARRALRPVTPERPPLQHQLHHVVPATARGRPLLGRRFFGHHESHMTGAHPGRGCARPWCKTTHRTRGKRMRHPFNDALREQCGSFLAEHKPNLAETGRI